MSLLDLTPDGLLSTTRSVRKRLDFSRPVETELIQQCLELAVQAPTGGNRQMWHFVVVTDEQQRKALGEVYRKGYTFYRQQVNAESANKTSSRLTRERLETLKKVQSSSDYL
ncbi:MAG: nitroreductase family protein, partial [Chloroflexota bacterium]